MKKSVVIALFGMMILMSCGGSQETTGIKMDPLKRGKYIYEANCVSCHQATGAGAEGLYPPLKGSDYLLANKGNGVNAVVNGLRGEIKVNGVEYDLYMPPVNIADEDVVHVLNYVRNSWGNKADSLTLEDVKKLK